MAPAAELAPLQPIGLQAYSPHSLAPTSPRTAQGAIPSPLLPEQDAVLWHSAEYRARRCLELAGRKAGHTNPHINELRILFELVSCFPADRRPSFYDARGEKLHFPFSGFAPKHHSTNADILVFLPGASLLSRIYYLRWVHFSMLVKVKESRAEGTFSGPGGATEAACIEGANRLARLAIGERNPMFAHGHLAGLTLGIYGDHARVTRFDNANLWTPYGLRPFAVNAGVFSRATLAWLGIGDTRTDERPAGGDAEVEVQVIKDARRTADNPCELVFYHRMEQTPARDGREHEADERSHVRFVMETAGWPLSHFRSTMELVTAIRDELEGHMEAWERGWILNRDVSIGDIPIVDRPLRRAPQCRGAIHDFDYSAAVPLFLDSTVQGSTLSHDPDPPLQGAQATTRRYRTGLATTSSPSFGSTTLSQSRPARRSSRSKASKTALKLKLCWPNGTLAVPGNQLLTDQLETL
ncbi:hypothetical protein BD413DRAFT_495606 [Trametes elegans]|nr:hypothetical protein BD413DRAFT_495606 [Trametes elegans]